MHQPISDQQLTHLARQFGTPLYVYHAETITRQYHLLHHAFGGFKHRIFYAAKALTNPTVLRHIHRLGAGIDCSSINEARIALLSGIPPQSLIYTSNGIAFEEIAEAVDMGIHVNIDSLSNLEKFATRYGHSVPVGLRLRPNIMAGGNLKISTGHTNSKFGIPIEQVDEVLHIHQRNPLHIVGLHIHTGSEILDASVFTTGLMRLLDLMPLFPELRFLDLGGGFKVAYEPGGMATNVVELGEKINALLASHPRLSKLELWFEPGKFLVSEAGYFITQTNVLKRTPSAEFVSVNSGFNHLIRPMFYDSYHHIRNISNSEGSIRPYAVVGNICETDTFAWNRELNEVREGDFLVFFNAGAYGFEMSSHFNSRTKPAEIWLENNVPGIIRRRDTLDDLLHNVVWPADLSPNRI
jgi:diaminopimelate decarboxylase